ncbi:MAG: hypothetical protein GYB68_09300 [Chloroflexi bacterium]|nr:hypothetical protein [Chloroflexota bacterium]
MDTEPLLPQSERPQNDDTPIISGTEARLVEARTHLAEAGLTFNPDSRDTIVGHYSDVELTIRLTDPLDLLSPRLSTVVPNRQFPDFWLATNFSQQIQTTNQWKRLQTGHATFDRQFLQYSLQPRKISSLLADHHGLCDQLLEASAALSVTFSRGKLSFLPNMLPGTVFKADEWLLYFNIARDFRAILL